MSWTIDAHAGHGQLHTRPFLDLADPRDVAKLEPMATRGLRGGLDSAARSRASTAAAWPGPSSSAASTATSSTSSARSRTPSTRYNLLNPGKVVGDDPHLMTRNLRPIAEPAAEPAVVRRSSTSGDGADRRSPVLVPVLRWRDGDPWSEAAACNGCGACRSHEPTLADVPDLPALAATRRPRPGTRPTCSARSPPARSTPSSGAPRSSRRTPTSASTASSAGRECPSGVDVSSLMLEAKAAYVENHGLPPGDWMLSRVELWSRLASRLPILWNALMANRAARWLIERLFGLSRHRRLPRAHRTPFVRRAERLGLTKPRPQAPGPRVAYFVDVFANYFDQELAEAVVGRAPAGRGQRLRPRRQRGSGMPALVAGDLDHARDLALANLRVLGDAVRDGYTVVCSEPTAALMLRHEYLKLTDDLDAALVAAEHDGPRPVPRRPGGAGPAPRARRIRSTPGSATTSPATSGPSTSARRAST